MANRNAGIKACVSRSSYRLFLHGFVSIAVAMGACAEGQETDARYDDALHSKFPIHALFEHDSISDRLYEVLPAKAVLPQAVFVPLIQGTDEFYLGDALLPSPDHGNTPVGMADDPAPEQPSTPSESEMLTPSQDRPRLRGLGDHFDNGLNRNAAHRRSRMPLGAVAGAYSSAPHMIGDFFGGTFLFMSPTNMSPSPGSDTVTSRTVSLAGGDRRFKVAENVSPLPQDRVFFNFNHFENTVVDANGQTRSLDRYTFGFEKTFARGRASIETRLPLVDGLNSRQVSGNPNTTASEFGNLAMALKVILFSGENWLLSGGSSMTFPTGDDFEYYGDGFSAPATRILLIENDAVHIAPFLGFLIQPERNWFAQAFIQADFDLNGNDVFGEFGFEGVLQDQNLLFMDASLGRWLYRRGDTGNRLTGISAIAELHYTSTMNDTDDVAGISNPDNRMDVLNAAAALHFQLHMTALRIGAAAPLRDGVESLFDAEVIFQVNRSY